MKFLLVFLFGLSAQAATTYYVNVARSDDTGNGLTAATAFKTIKCAIRTNASAGDTVYIAPGVYRELLILNRSGSAGSLINVIGDPRNEQGFAGISAAPVRITGHTTDDKTDATGAPLTTTSYSYYKFENLWLDGGKYNAVVIGAASTNLTYTNCLITSYKSSSYSSAVNMTPAIDKPLNCTFNNCILKGVYSGLTFDAAAAPSAAELNVNVGVTNCLIQGGLYGVFIRGKAGSYAFAGVNMDSCTISADDAIAYNESTAASGTIKNGVHRCILNGTYGLFGGSTAVFDNDWNLFYTSTAVNGTGQAVGANDKAVYAMLHEFGQSPMWFHVNKETFAPTIDSPSLGFDGSGASQTIDINNRMRPSGSGPTWGTSIAAVGAFDLHDFAAQDTTVYDTGAASIRLTGSGDQMVVVPVAAQATTITVRTQYDSNYGAGTKPQAILLAHPELGSVSTQTVTATSGTANTWETLSFSSFTPSKSGAVIVRLISNAAGTGKCYFDTVARNY